MGITLHTFVTNEIPTAANFNTWIRDNFSYISAAIDFWSCSYVIYDAATGPVNEVGNIRMGPAPSFLSGYNLTKATFSQHTNGTTHPTEATIERGRQPAPGTVHTWVDMFTTHPTIDIGEYCSLDGAVPGVVDTANDDVEEGDQWRVETFTHQTGSSGLFVTLEFEKP